MFATALFVALLTQVSAVNVSPLIAAGADVQKVMEASVVGPIPGITTASYAGLISTNVTDNAEAFYWYFPPLNGNLSAPVIVWLQGGPGSSSLFGAFLELGPYRINANLTAEANPFTWGLTNHLVFLDNPRGTGFSSADTLCTDWQCYGGDFDVFIRQFLQGYGLLPNQLWITGESYGGHYVPASAYRVHLGNAGSATPKVNLQGIAIGNGFVAPLEMSGGYADLIFQTGLISLPEYAVAQQYVRNITAAIAAGDLVAAYLVWDAFLNGDSTPGGAWYTNVTGLTNYFNIAEETPAAYSYLDPWVNSAAVRSALGVGARPYQDGNLAVELALKGDVMFSQKPNLEALLTAGYGVLLYNGALDIICGAPLTERYVPTLTWPGSQGWLASSKVQWHDPATPGAVSGYSRSFSNLNHVVMRGAGHMA